MLKAHGDHELGAYFLGDVQGAIPLLRANGEAVDELFARVGEHRDLELADSLKSLSARGIDPGDVSTWPSFAGQPSSDAWPDRE